MACCFLLGNVHRLFVIWWKTGGLLLEQFSFLVKAFSVHLSDRFWSLILFLLSLTISNFRIFAFPATRQSLDQITNYPPMSGILCWTIWLIHPSPLTENFCNRAVGIQKGRIRNKAMTASSSYNNFHVPFLGRLHRAKRGRYVGAWCARHNNHNQWLQVDLGRTMKITGIATQGRQDASQWVTSYWVWYSSDGTHFAIVKHWWSYVKVMDYNIVSTGCGVIRTLVIILKRVR